MRNVPFWRIYRRKYQMLKPVLQKNLKISLLSVDRDETTHT